MKYFIMRDREVIYHVNNDYALRTWLESTKETSFTVHEKKNNTAYWHPSEKKWFVSDASISNFDTDKFLKRFQKINNKNEQARLALLKALEGMKKK